MADQIIPPVDIIIPTRNRGALIAGAIASICCSSYRNFTLWVADQSDNDHTEQEVARYASTDGRVRYLRLRSRGISMARNSGAAAGTAPFMLFTDDDCSVTPEWIGAMLAELSQPDTWAVFGRVLPERDDELIPTDVRLAAVGLDMATKLSPQRAVYEANRYNLGFGHGASMGVRREAYERVGGFDELLGTGGPLRSWEDRDFGYRILAAGGRIVYTPEALLYHRQWRGWSGVRRAYRDYALGTGAVVAKYLRCGDRGAWLLLGEWLLGQGLRQAASGLLKWRSWQKFYIGLQQLAYPWVGLAIGLCHPVDRERGVYHRAGAGYGPTPPVEEERPDPS